MRHLSTLGIAWRLTITQTVIILVAGIAADGTAALIIAVTFLFSNTAITALVDRRNG